MSGIVFRGWLSADDVVGVFSTARTYATALRDGSWVYYNRHDALLGLDANGSVIRKSIREVHDAGLIDLPAGKSAAWPVLFDLMEPLCAMRTAAGLADPAEAAAVLGVTVRELNVAEHGAPPHETLLKVARAWLAAVDLGRVRGLLADDVRLVRRWCERPLEWNGELPGKA